MKKINIWNQVLTRKGGIISKKGRIDEEIKYRITRESTSTGALTRVLSSEIICRTVKIRIYITIIKPVVLFASETSTLTKKQRKEQDVWRKNILRGIYVGRKENGVQRTRTNKNIYTLYGEPKLPKVIKVQKIRWLGHILRKEKSRIINDIRDLRIIGNRGKEKPDVSWKDWFLTRS